MGSSAGSGLEARAKTARKALDAWVREVVAWHFDPATGTPFWLDFAKRAGWDPRREVKGYADLERFGYFQDEWLRGGPVRRWVPLGYKDRPVYVFETGGSTQIDKAPAQAGRGPLTVNLDLTAKPFAEAVGAGLYRIDTLYVRPGLAASHLLVSDGRAAFVDTGAAPALPRLLGALEEVGVAREQVDWLILTHVHLDRAGGAGQLIAALPHARAVLHPRGAPHLIDRAKLIAGTIEVYGRETYARLYGELVPIPADRVHVVTDGERLMLGSRQIKADDASAFLPVILVTAYEERGQRTRALDSSADELLIAPVNRLELVARVRSLLRLKLYHQDLVRHESVVLSLSAALEAKDPYTRGHSQRVGDLSRRLAMAMELEPAFVGRLRTAGLLHDIGKVAIPQSLLNKPGWLTREEFAKVMTHPVVGWEICRRLRSAEPVLDAILYHHERFDGSGYPRGLAGDVGDPGMPRASRGAKPLIEAELFAASGEATPSMAPLPNRSGCLETRFSAR